MSPAERTCNLLLLTSSSCRAVLSAMLAGSAIKLLCDRFSCLRLLSALSAETSLRRLLPTLRRSSFARLDSDDGNDVSVLWSHASACASAVGFSPVVYHGCVAPSRRSAPTIVTVSGATGHGQGALCWSVTEP